MRDIAGGGTSVLLVSSDYEELVGVCDRILVIANGRIVAEGRPPEADRHWVAEKAHQTSGRDVAAGAGR